MTRATWMIAWVLMGVFFWASAARADEDSLHWHIDYITCDYGDVHDGMDLCPFMRLPLECRRRAVKFFKWTEETKSVLPAVQREITWMVNQQDFYDLTNAEVNRLCVRWIQYRVSVKYAWMMFNAYATELRR